MNSRFKPASEEELARRGIGVKKSKVRARNTDGRLKSYEASTPNVNGSVEEKPGKESGRPNKKRG